MNVEYVKSKDDEVTEFLIKSNLPILIYGNGSIADQVEVKLKKNNLLPSGRIVDDEYFLGDDGTIKASECDGFFDTFILIKGFFDSYFMLDSELNARFKNAKDIIYYSELYGMEELNYNYFLEHKKEFESFYNLLEDDLSKKSYEAYLNSKINKNSSYLLKYVTLPQYAPSVNVSNGTKLKEFMSFTNDKTWINCGAFDGDTIKSLVVDRGFVFKDIMAIEPDSINAKKIYSFIAKQNLMDVVKVYECGLSDNTMKVSFNSAGTAKSSISDNNLGDDFIQLRKIDDIARDNEVSFINMDIEGSECNALRGGVETIKKYKPKLAISAYHKRNDLINIPNLIRSINCEYKFYFRIHKPITIDSILYAV